MTLYTFCIVKGKIFCTNIFFQYAFELLALARPVRLSKHKHFLQKLIITLFLLFDFLLFSYLIIIRSLVFVGNIK